MIARDKDVVTLTTVTPRGAKRSSTVLLALIHRDAQKEKERPSRYLVHQCDSFTLEILHLQVLKLPASNRTS